MCSGRAAGSTGDRATVAVPEYMPYPGAGH